MRDIFNGVILRHRNCLDVDMRVLAVSYKCPEYYKLKVVWVNRWWKDVLHFDTVKLMVKDIKNWTRV